MIANDYLSTIYRIYTIEEYNGIIHISGVFCCNKELPGKPIAYYNYNHHYASVSTDINQSHVLFIGHYKHNIIVDFEIPFTVKGFLKLYYITKEDSVTPLKCELTVYARINDKLFGSFTIGEQCIIVRDNNSIYQHSFIIEKMNYVNIRRIVNSYVINHYTDEQHREDIAIIDSYLNTLELISDKKIWLFMDRPHSACENVEYLFAHCSKIDDGILKYFIIDEDSSDAARISKYGTIIGYGSSRHKLLLILAEKFISSFIEYSYEYLFGAKGDTMLYMLYRGLIKNKMVYLQQNASSEDISIIKYLESINKNINIYHYNTIENDKVYKILLRIE